MVLKNEFYWPIGTMVRVLTSGLGDWGSIPKSQKMVSETSLLKTQNYKNGPRISGTIQEK